MLSMLTLMAVLGSILMHWKWLVVGVAIRVPIGAARAWANHHLAMLTAQQRRHEALAARADQQHDEVLRGDGHGTYSDGWPVQQRFEQLSKFRRRI